MSTCHSELTVTQSTGLLRGHCVRHLVRSIFFPFQGIDPDLFFDDDRSVYVQGSWQMDRLTQPSCTIKQFEMSEPREIWGGFARYDTEGPHIYKRGAWYYLLVAEGGTFEHHLLSIARSRNVAGPYESFADNPILTADGKDEYIQNVGHGDLFQDEYGSWWAAVLGVRDQPGQPLGRETFLTSVDWPEGGWPRISQPAMKFDRHAVLGTEIKHRTAYDEHDGFCYVRNPDLSHYLLSRESPGLIRLRATSNSLSSPTGTLTFVGKRQRSTNCVATAILEVPFPSEPPENFVAGLALYKDHLRHASIAYNSNASQVQLDISNSESDIRHTKAHKVASTMVNLGFRIVASQEKYIFYFQEGLALGSNWVELGSIDVQTLYAREFTGPMLGIFATGRERDAVFRDFVVE
ncbi:xylosidase/arabinosidase [Diaporthe sp. PMI_573]|nr:xylosidase/arabinosidase [Diaporthaceae sp. PMI_573]